MSLAETERLNRRLQAENLHLQEEIRSTHDFDEPVGNSEVLRLALGRVEQVAPTDSTVLLLGESGTGKDLLARAIHGRSPRRERRLVRVTCAALPGGLIESELFGHERGAFTGAVAQREGRFEIADGGTLFLDEVPQHAPVPHEEAGHRAAKTPGGTVTKAAEPARRTEEDVESEDQTQSARQEAHRLAAASSGGGRARDGARGGCHCGRRLVGTRATQCATERCDGTCCASGFRDAEGPLAAV